MSIWLSKLSIWLSSWSSEQVGGEGRDARGALARAGGVAQRAVEWAGVAEYSVEVAEDSVEVDVELEVEVEVSQLCK